MHQFLFDTRDFPVADRFERWRAGLSDFDVSRLDSEGPFEATTLVTGLGPLPITESVLPALRFQRTAAMIRARRRDYWNLNLMLEGVLRGHADGEPFEVHPGTPVLFDLSRPVEMVTEPVRAIVVVLPRNLLGRGRRASAHGPLPPSAERTLLSTYLRALCEALPSLADTAALPAARALCDLVAACLPPTAKPSVPIIRGEALRARVLEFVDAHVGEALPAERLCAELGVSRSSLYRALEGDGGAAELVRRVRLEVAHRMLSDRTEGRTIQQIAHAAGFTDETVFSRQFRAAFGYTAAELRRTAAVPSALPPASPDLPQAYRNAVGRVAAGPDAG